MAGSVPEQISAAQELEYCDLGIAYRCNCRCVMCELWKDNPLSEHNVLSLERWKTVLEQISTLPRKRRLQINFSGPGEAFLRPGIFELIKTARARGLNVHIITNGTAIDAAAAQAAGESGLYSLGFSLDSCDARTHDFLRGVPGTHERVLRAIRETAAHAPDTKIGINAVISRVNFSMLGELVEWAESRDEISYISFQALTQPFSFHTPADPFWFARENYGLLWPDEPALVERVIDGLIAAKLSGGKILNSAEQLNVYRAYFLNPAQFVRTSRCNLGKGNLLVIDPVGLVSACHLIGVMGTVNGPDTLAQILSSTRARRHRLAINQCRRNCHLVVSCYFQEEDQPYRCYEAER